MTDTIKLFRLGVLIVGIFGITAMFAPYVIVKVLLALGSILTLAAIGEAFVNKGFEGIFILVAGLFVND